MPAASLVYRLGFALAATLAIATPAAAQSDDQALALLPCEQVASVSFETLFSPESGVDVIDIGTVVKETGNNLCSTLIDTTIGRIRLLFTTERAVNGGSRWRTVSATLVPDSQPPPGQPPDAAGILLGETKPAMLAQAVAFPLETPLQEFALPLAAGQRYSHVLSSFFARSRRTRQAGLGAYRRGTDVAPALIVTPPVMVPAAMMPMPMMPIIIDGVRWSPCSRPVPHVRQRGRSPAPPTHQAARL